MPVEKCLVRPWLRRRRHRPGRRLTDSPDALLETLRGSRRKGAGFLNRAPAALSRSNLYSFALRRDAGSVDDARMAGRSWHQFANQTLFGVSFVPTDGTRTANMGDRGLRYVADFRAALGQ